MNRALLLVVAVIAVLGCADDDATPAAAGEACSVKADCAEDLVCAFGRCHMSCEEDDECPGGARCVSGVATNVCQLGDDVACEETDDCRGEQLCSIDKECRDPCDSDSDCTATQLCTESGYCASTDPSRDTLIDGRLLAPGEAPPDAGMGAGDGGGDGGDGGGGGGGDGDGDGASGDVVLSNLDPADLPRVPAVDLQITGMCRVDTSEGALRCSSTGTASEDGWSMEIVEADDGARIAVLRARSVQVEMGAFLTVTGGLPLALVADDTVRVLGRISAAADKASEFGGGFPAEMGPGAGREGTVGQFRPGSGGSYCGLGGKGAAEDGMSGAEPRSAYGTPELVPMLGGSGGGHDSGGAGGGALQIVAGKAVVVTLTGVLDAGGGGGRGGSGGGSGGSVLIEAPEVSIAGWVAANGGGGAASVGGSGGQNAQTDDTPAPAELPDLGGEGSAGTEIHGSDGDFDTENEALAGGGGAGRIRINTADGEAEVTGNLSPALDTECATIGVLPEE